jgi:hypothetical protein
LPTAFGWVTGTTGLAESVIGDWVQDIIEPLGGDVVEWAYGAPRPIRD